jgi:D-alanyl-D-alanine dipeptidase
MAHSNLLCAALLYSTLFFEKLACEIPQEFRNKGFVYLHEIDPTIQVSVRYATNENFVGRPIAGYKKPIIIMVRKAAETLKAVQQEVAKDGYSLVVYDAYRPQKAVDYFAQWGKDQGDVIKKSHYYPDVRKEDLFKLGYIMAGGRSGHSRGSRVDVTLIKKDEQIHPVVEVKRVLHNGSVIMFLDDGTVDMGSSFDLFDVASHFDNDVIDEKYKPMRAYLRKMMESHGFEYYPEEWWHFSLKDEPHKSHLDSSYFNFDIA